jgi:hypothetical protein
MNTMSQSLATVKYLNLYSWAIIFAYICASLFMQDYHSKTISLEGFFLGLPVIGVMVYWSEHSARLIKMSELSLKKNELLFRDMFLICYSALLGDLFSLIFQYGNSDVRAWWTLFLYFSGICYLIFAFIFSLIALMLHAHKLYTIVFSCFIFIIFAFSKFWPHTISIIFFGKIDTFFAIMAILILVHLILSMGNKIMKKFSL